MSNTRRPSAARQHTRTTEKAQDDQLDKGIRMTEVDGSTLTVRVRDVKGKHDAALVAACGLDFMGLLEKLNERQGLDLLAAALWFARLVNDREPGDLAELLEEFGYEDIAEMDFGPAEDEAGDDAAPEAPGGS